MNNRFAIFISLISVLSSSIFAETLFPVECKFNTLYLHPVSFFTSLDEILLAPDHFDPLLKISLSYERYFRSASSLIINPGIGYRRYNHSDFEFSGYFGFGMRKYLSIPMSSIYFQSMVLPEYRKLVFTESISPSSQQSSFCLPILGFLGIKMLARKLAIDLNIGTGYSFGFFLRHPHYGVFLEGNGGGFVLKANCGIGINF